ncbi:hypothetical protein pb186bvf_020202 [Paramecium bursaria]
MDHNLTLSNLRGLIHQKILNYEILTKRSSQIFKPSLIYQQKDCYLIQVYMEIQKKLFYYLNSNNLNDG